MKYIIIKKPRSKTPHFQGIKSKISYVVEYIDIN